jgi:TonB family protein
MASSWRVGSIVLALTWLAAIPLDGQRGRATAPRDPYEPAMLVAGQPPELPAVSVSGAGQVALEVSLNSTGANTGIELLTTTPPFTAMMIDAVRGWRFDPATEEDKTVEAAAAPVTSPTPAAGTAASRGAAPGERPRIKLASKVLVLGVFNAPVTLGPTLNEPPSLLKPGSPEVPWPTGTLDAPPNSVTTRVSTTVLIEAHVSAAGRVDRARVVRSGPPYDAPALDVVRAWTFRPARRGNLTVPSLVYVVFGFPLPSRNS